MPASKPGELGVAEATNGLELVAASLASLLLLQSAPHSPLVSLPLPFVKEIIQPSNFRQEPIEIDVSWPELSTESLRLSRSSGTKQGALKLLVTGGAGFIGSHVCDAFLADGHEVIALDSLEGHYPPETKLGNLASARDYNSFGFVQGDVRDSACLLSLPAVDAVVHLAARSGVRPSLQEPRPYVDVNVNGTRNLLNWAQAREVPRLIFASSSSVYGNNPNSAFTETDPVDRQLSPYAETKRLGETLLEAATSSGGPGVACLRIFSAYGPRQRPDLALHKFARLLRNGDELPVFGDGRSGRDYTFIDDVVGTVRAALEWVEKGNFDVFNVGAGETVLLRDMVNRLGREMGLSPKVKRLPPHAADVYSTCADLTHTRAVLGYRPKTHFPEGLSQFMKWFRTGNP